MSFRVLVTLLAASGLVACASSSREPMPNHDDTAAEIHGLERESGDGPYLTGVTETFHLSADEGLSSIRWSATAGSLTSSGDRATWTMPKDEGVASLTVTALTKDGAEKTATWNFQVSAATVSHRDELLAQAIPVLDGGTNDATGSSCELQYDSANNLHLGFRNDTHPGLFYGQWNGSVWNVQIVDGMGFNVGGLVDSEWAMTVDPTNHPHFAYRLDNNQIWYATYNGTSWTRERVDNTQPAYNNSGYRMMTIALNPAQANRPTILYVGLSATNYPHIVAAVRTGANTWTNTQLTWQGGASSYQYMAGQALYTTAGNLIVPIYLSGFNAALGFWDGTTTTPSQVDLTAAGAGNTAPWDVWVNAAWASTTRAVYRTRSAIYDVNVGNPITASTAADSNVEVSGSTVGDVAWQSKPYLLHMHGSNVELVTSNPQGFWSYTQLGTANTGSKPSLSVSSTGNVSICYQSPGGQVTFQ
ncbi:MAG: hypothetical protein ACJ790_05530 [Myxococcaceae bacterium]